MLVKSFFSALAGSILAATPALAAPSTLEARAVSFRFCKDVEFGRCLIKPITQGECVNVPAGWNDVISSAKTNDPDWQCVIYRDYNCEVQLGEPVTWDHRNRDLGRYGFNDTISSWRCDFI